MKIPFKIIIPILAVFLLVCGFLVNRSDSNLVKGYGRTPQKGEIAPQIQMEDMKGNVRKLSDTRGKIVLIDFWASWCKPCRAENPHLVSAYNKYKNTKFGDADGFTIFSVSLDNSIESWRAAVRRDGLIWEDHVSDLKGWNNAAAVQYNINSIPSNFLIDENGKILAVDISGATLEQELSYLKRKN